jgi:hypothetical protein
MNKIAAGMPHRFANPAVPVLQTWLGILDEPKAHYELREGWPQNEQNLG